MAGLVPAIDAFLTRHQDLDARHKAGHDGGLCSPCHDRLGTGDGMIVRRGYRKPPSFHIDRLRKVPDGYIFDVITNGFGAMPDYAAQVSARDRWAIVAYVRALQYSQQATLEDVPPDQRGELNRGGAK